MSLGTSRLFSAASLLICFVCPILEVFDYWDRTAQTGNDTEYVLVLVSLCIGAAFAIARWIASSQLFRLAEVGRAYLTQRVVVAFPPLFTIGVTASPPPLSLRV